MVGLQPFHPNDWYIPTRLDTIYGNIKKELSFLLLEEDQDVMVDLAGELVDMLLEINDKD